MVTVVNPARRIVLALAGTATTVVLLFGYHTSTMGALTAAGATPTTGVISSSSGSASSGSGDTGSTPADGSGDAGSGSDPEATRTVTGSTVQTQWGPVQVQLRVSGGTITDVSVLQYPSGNGRDLEINNYALPILVQSTLDQQSADLDMVSGATVTSVGYLQSLQSALDAAGL